MREERKNRMKKTLFATKVLFLVIFTSKFVIFGDTGKAWMSFCNENESGLIANYLNTTTPGGLTAKWFYIVHPGQNALVTVFGLIKNRASAVSLKVFCVIVDLLILVSILNVTEGVLHYRIGKFLKK